MSVANLTLSSTGDRPSHGVPPPRGPLPSVASLEAASRFTLHASRFLLGLSPVLLFLLLWNLARSQAPGFLELSLVNYGGLFGDPAGFGWRWAGFLRLLSYVTGAPVLNGIFLAGLPLLLLGDIWRAKGAGEQGSRGALPSLHPSILPSFHPDWLLFLFCLFFLVGHALLSFQVWDRYLLGLVPFLALLLARVLLLPWRIITTLWLQDRSGRRPWAGRLAGLALALLLAATLARPVQDAVNGRYPLGSNSGALAGVNQVVAYLRGQVGANNTLYHHWLGTHWRFYLWGYPYDLQYWASPQSLAARARPGHLIVFPSWQSDTEARLALAAAGLTLRELIRAYHPAGYPSMILYRLEPLPAAEDREQPRAP